MTVELSKQLVNSVTKGGVIKTYWTYRDGKFGNERPMEGMKGKQEIDQGGKFARVQGWRNIVDSTLLAVLSLVGARPIGPMGCQFEGGWRIKGKTSWLY